MKHLKALCLLVMIISLLPAFSQTVEIILIQDEGITTPRSLELSEFVVSGGLDALFESGFIATNARPVAGSRDQYLAVKPNYDTLAGSIDYLVIVFASYTATAVLEPPRLDYRLMEVVSRNILKEGQIQPSRAANQTAVGIEKAAVDTGVSLIKNAISVFRQ